MHAVCVDVLFSDQVSTVGTRPRDWQV